MIYGIGTDIVRIERLGRPLQRYGGRFAQRILTATELAEFTAGRCDARFLAKRFAAKEATVKALGTGFRDGVGLRDIGVVHDALGKPGLAFSAGLAQRLAVLGIADWHLSLSDERDYAIAFVVLTR